MRIGNKPLPSIYELLGFLLIVSIWAFNEEKYITYPVKIVFILAYGYYWAKSRNGKINRYQAWCIIMCIISVMAAFNASSQSVARHTLINVIQVFLIAFVLSGYLSTREEVIKYLKYFVTGGLVLLIRLVIVTPTSVWTSYSRLGQAIGYNANDVGNKAAIAAIIALCFFREKNENHKKFYLSMFIAMSAIVLFSGSRKALLAVVVAIILLYTIGLENKRNILFTIVGLSIMMYAVYYLMMNNSSLYMTIGRRVESMINVLFHGGSEASSIDLREKYIQMAWAYIKESPVLGIGLGGFAVKSGLGIYCHCDYLEVMCSYGIPGAIIYYFPTISLFLKNLSLKRKNMMDYSILIICAVLIISYITMVMYISAYVQVIYALVYSYISVSKRERALE